MTAVAAEPKTSYVTTLGLNLSAVSEFLGVTTNGVAPKLVRKCMTVMLPIATAATTSIGSHTRLATLIIAATPSR
ncbi:Uncharacterised protein [Mycobacteroides abscessus subsp. abscessus]|nr:Uncharacterised protein [Mycobacteroides abscessus subsp. abscessus]